MLTSAATRISNILRTGRNHSAPRLSSRAQSKPVFCTIDSLLQEKASEISLAALLLDNTPVDVGTTADAALLGLTIYFY